MNFINAGLDMEMPGPPRQGNALALPSFFDSEPPPPSSPAQSIAGVAESILGGRLPEKPAPEPFSAEDFGVELDAKKMPEALKHGTVSEAAVTRAAGYVLSQIVRLAYLDGLSKHDVTAQSIDENAKIIEKTGEDAAVLLKNEGGVLPLKAADLDQVVLIGPGAGQVMAIGISGERSLGLPERQVGPLDAMRKISGNSNIHFAVDDDMTGSIVPASAFTHDGQPGLERIDASGGTIQTDAQLNFTIKGGNALPSGSTLTWKGTRPCLTQETTGSICRPWVPMLPCFWTGRNSPPQAHSRVRFTAIFFRPTRTTLFPPPTAWTTSAAPSS